MNNESTGLYCRHCNSELTQEEADTYTSICERCIARADALCDAKKEEQSC